MRPEHRVRVGSDYRARRFCSNVSSGVKRMTALPRETDVPRTRLRDSHVNSGHTGRRKAGEACNTFAPVADTATIGAPAAAAPRPMRPFRRTRPIPRIPPIRHTRRTWGVHRACPARPAEQVIRHRRRVSLNNPRARVRVRAARSRPRQPRCTSSLGRAPAAVQRQTTG